MKRFAFVSSVLLVAVLACDQREPAADANPVSDGGAEASTPTDARSRDARETSRDSMIRDSAIDVLDTGRDVEFSDSSDLGIRIGDSEIDLGRVLVDFDLVDGSMGDDIHVPPPPDAAEPDVGPADAALERDAGGPGCVDAVEVLDEGGAPTGVLRCDDGSYERVLPAGVPAGRGAGVPAGVLPTSS